MSIQDSSEFGTKIPCLAQPDSMNFKLPECQLFTFILKKSVTRDSSDLPNLDLKGLHVIKEHLKRF